MSTIVKKKRHEEQRNYNHKISALGRIDILIQEANDKDIIEKLKSIRREVAKIK